MKFTGILLLSIISHLLAAQRFIVPEGEFMDTTRQMSPGCAEASVYYYSVTGKHPKSSMTLLGEVRTFLGTKGKMYKGDGYVTFRFQIDCSGQKARRTEVLQTDEQYRPAHFEKELVSNLYEFLNNLNGWKVVKDKRGVPQSYSSYLTFKIQHGEVVNVIP